MPRYAARTDANHTAIREAFRALGWTVIDTARVGNGFPDLLAIKAGRVEFIEVKDGAKVLSKQKATPAELKVYDTLIGAGVRVRYITSVDQVVALHGDPSGITVVEV